MPGLQNVYENLQAAKAEELIQKETAQINIDWIYNVYLLGYFYSKPGPESGQWQGNYNLYLVYLYTVILTSQEVLIKTLIKFKDNKYIQDLKTAKLLSDKDVAYQKNQILYCLSRFEIYETILKQMFNIPLKETSFQKIGQHLPVYNSLTPKQLTDIQTKIVDPIFNGKFYNIYGSPLLSVSCTMNELGVKSNCKLFSVSSFPFPALDKNFETSPDCIAPFVLWNEVAFAIKQSIQIMGSVSVFHRFLAGLTGHTVPEWVATNKIVHDFTEWVKEKAGDAEEGISGAIDAAAALGGEMYKAGQSVVGAISSIPQKTDTIKIALALGAIGALTIYFLSEK